MEKKPKFFTLLQVNYWYVPPLSMLGGAKKKIVLNMYCSLLNTKYIHVHKYHNVRWFTLKPYKCLCQWTHLREKKGNKMLEVRRGWDGKKLLLFSLLIHREWKKNVSTCNNKSQLAKFCDSVRFETKKIISKKNNENLNWI